MKENNKKQDGEKRVYRGDSESWVIPTSRDTVKKHPLKIKKEQKNKDKN